MIVTEEDRPKKPKCRRCKFKKEESRLDTDIEDTESKHKGDTTRKCTICKWGKPVSLEDVGQDDEDHKSKPDRSPLCSMLRSLCRRDNALTKFDETTSDEGEEKPIQRRKRRRCTISKCLKRDRTPDIEEGNSPFLLLCSKDFKCSVSCFLVNTRKSMRKTF